MGVDRCLRTLSDRRAAREMGTALLRMVGAPRGHPFKTTTVLQQAPNCHAHAFLHRCPDHFPTLRRPTDQTGAGGGAGGLPSSALLSAATGSFGVDGFTTSCHTALSLMVMIGASAEPCRDDVVDFGESGGGG